MEVFGDVEVVKPAGYGMDQRATECIRKWRFKPGAKDGSPVDVAFRFAYSFGLQPQPRIWGAEREPGNETVLFEFSASSTGEVSNIRALDERGPSLYRSL